MSWLSNLILHYTRIVSLNQMKEDMHGFHMFLNVQIVNSKITLLKYFDPRSWSFYNSAWHLFCKWISNVLIPIHEAQRQSEWVRAWGMMLSKKGRECADNYSLRETANVRVRERVAIFADCLDVEEREREVRGGREGADILFLEHECRILRHCWAMYDFLVSHFQASIWALNRRRGNAHKQVRKTVLTFNTSQQCLRILTPISEISSKRVCLFRALCCASLPS